VQKINSTDQFDAGQRRDDRQVSLPSDGAEADDGDAHGIPILRPLR
jgi:hypothetical protein